jgi:D-alanyl-D-alanine carboxypeptidase/D-alanyl-D-alanine-endopeptidase (penicillin-binding protein 4)
MGGRSRSGTAVRRRLAGSGCALLAGLALAALLGSPAGAGTAHLSARQVAQRVKQVLDRPGLPPGFWGVSVIDVETGKPLYAWNERRLFVPASIQKIITGYAAWRVFGPDHRFRTGIATTGRLDTDGTLRGPLIIQGGGDPSWSFRFFEDDPIRPVQAFAAELVRQTGIRRVEGDIIADATAQLDEPYAPDWSWEEFQWSYGAKVCALALNDGTMELQVGPGEPGQPVRVAAVPDYLLSQVRNYAVTARDAGSDELVVYKPFDSDEFFLSGRLPALASRRVLRVAVSDPALTAGQFIGEALRRQGVAVGGEVRARHRRHYLPEVPPAGPVTPLGAVEGKTLEMVLIPMMERSINNYAEVLLRNLAGGQVPAGSTDREAGIRVIYQLWPELMEPRKNIAMTDGSGLSRRNLVTPRLMSDLLCLIARAPDFERFAVLLPASGQEGTLRNRLGGRTTGNVLAKTGRLSTVVSMAGFVRTSSGRLVAFCFIVNNVPPGDDSPKWVIDEIVKILYRY